MTFCIAVMANITGCVAFMLMSRKIWWAPLFGFCQQGLWAWWAVADRLWPLFITTIWFAGWYAAAIPKWWRER